MSEKQISGDRVQGYLFLLLYGLLLVAMGFLFQPFFTVMVWAGVAYAITFPLYARLITKKNGQERTLLVRTILASVMAVGTLLVIVGPLVFVGFVFWGQLNDLLKVARNVYLSYGDVFNQENLAPILEGLREFSGGLLNFSTENIGQQIMGALQVLGERAAGMSAILLRDVVATIVGFAFFAFTLFFFYLDGRHLVRVLLDAMPIRNQLTTVFLKKFRDTGRDVILGYFLIGLFQGFMGFLVYLVMGVPGPLVLGLLTTIASFIPIAGTGLVWVPLVIIRASSGDVWGALLLMVLSGFFISTLDNFLRPLFLHSRIKLHPLLIFFSILGGLNLFGFNGLILGPLVLVIFFTAVDIYAWAYGKKLRRHETGDEDPLEQNGV